MFPCQYSDVSTLNASRLRSNLFIHSLLEHNELLESRLEVETPIAALQFRIPTRRDEDAGQQIMSWPDHNSRRIRAPGLGHLGLRPRIGYHFPLPHRMPAHPSLRVFPRWRPCRLPDLLDAELGHISQVALASLNSFLWFLL